MRSGFCYPTCSIVSIIPSPRMRLAKYRIKSVRAARSPILPPKSSVCGQVLNQRVTASWLPFSQHRRDNLSHRPELLAAEQPLVSAMSAQTRLGRF
jgi:hypothetical protein